VGSIEQVSKLLNASPHQMIKTLILSGRRPAGGRAGRGDHDANEGKIRRALGVKQLEMAPPDVIQQATTAPGRFAGPVGLAIPIWADHDLASLRNAITAPMSADKHYVGVTWPRLPGCHGALCQTCATRSQRIRSALRWHPGVETGHRSGPRFKLGTK